MRHHVRPVRQRLDEDDQSIDDTECSEDYLTGYTVIENDGRVTVSAPDTEDVDLDDAITPEDISVTR